MTGPAMTFQEKMRLRAARFKDTPAQMPTPPVASSKIQKVIAKVKPVNRKPRPQPQQKASLDELKEVLRAAKELRTTVVSDGPRAPVKLPRGSASSPATLDGGNKTRKAAAACVASSAMKQKLLQRASRFQTKPTEDTAAAAPPTLQSNPVKAGHVANRQGPTVTQAHVHPIQLPIKHSPTSSKAAKHSPPSHRVAKRPSEDHPSADDYAAQGFESKPITLKAGSEEVQVSCYIKYPDVDNTTPRGRMILEKMAEQGRLRDLECQAAEAAAKAEEAAPSELAADEEPAAGCEGNFLLVS